MSCGYSTRYKLKHIVISNNIFLEFIFYFYCFNSSVFFSLSRQGFPSFAWSYFILFLLTFYHRHTHRRSVVWRFCYLCVYANVGTVLLIIWFGFMALALVHSVRDIRVVGRLVVIRCSWTKNDKLFTESRCDDEVECLVGFLWGKLSNLYVDSGLCRCVSRKKNAVLWFKAKKPHGSEKNEKRGEGLRKSIFCHIPLCHICEWNNISYRWRRQCQYKTGVSSWSQFNRTEILNEIILKWVWMCLCQMIFLLVVQQRHPIVVSSYVVEQKSAHTENGNNEFDCPKEWNFFHKSFRWLSYQPSSVLRMQK